MRIGMQKVTECGLRTDEATSAEVPVYMGMLGRGRFFILGK